MRGDSAVAIAYGHVVRGYETALTMPDLPPDEIECLRALLRAARELAQLPPLIALRSASEDLRISRPAG